MAREFGPVEEKDGAPGCREVVSGCAAGRSPPDDQDVQDTRHATSMGQARPEAEIVYARAGGIRKACREQLEGAEDTRMVRST